MMSWGKVLHSTMLVASGLLLCGLAYARLVPHAVSSQPPAPPRIEVVRGLAELTVMEVQVADVAEGLVEGYTGGTSVIALVHGTAAVGVDLEQARYVRVDPAHMHLVLALPQPLVRRVMIDPDRTHVLNSDRRGLWRLAFGSAHEGRAVAEALACGRDRLAHAAAHAGVVRQAREQTERVLGRFLAELGWSLDVRWAGGIK